MGQASFEGIEPEVLPAPAGNRGRGRPRGSKGKFRSTLDKALRSRWHEALDQLMLGVMTGDPTCMRIYWERVMPAPKRMAIELSMADGKPLTVETPADARAAMAHVLSMVAAGELAGDEGDELITCYAKFLAANSIHTIGEATDPASAGEDARTKFSERLRAIVRARAAAPAADPEPAPEMSEDELTARVMAAVERKMGENCD
jgi:hypothetical protein